MLKFLKKIFAILLIIIAIICFILAAIVSLGFSLPFLAAVSASTWVAIGCLAVGTAYITDADTASRYMSKVGQAVGDVAKGAGQAIGSAVKGLIQGSGAITFIILALGGYFFYTSLKDSNDDKN